MRYANYLDQDVEKLLRKEVREWRMPFKQILNNAIRNGLRSGKQPARLFRQTTFNMGKPLVDLTKALLLASELEDEESIGKHRRVDDLARRERLDSRAPESSQSRYLRRTRYKWRWVGLITLWRRSCSRPNAISTC